MELENASQKYSWVEVYGEGVKAVLVEDSVVWASRSDSTASTGSSASSWPALVSARLKSGRIVTVMYSKQARGSRLRRSCNL